MPFRLSLVSLLIARIRADDLRRHYRMRIKEGLRRVEFKSQLKEEHFHFFTSAESKYCRESFRLR